MNKPFSISTTDAQVVSAVKDTLNIAAAASLLSLPKTTLSSILSKLEKKLENHLFIRKQGSGEVTITDFGYDIIPKLEKILWISENIRSQTDLQNGQFNTGKISIVATQTILESFFAPYVQAFVENNPHITLTLHQKDSNIYYQPQASDIFIGCWEDNAENYIYLPFHRFRQKLWASQSYLDRTGTIDEVTDVEHRHIILEQSTFNQDQIFRRAGISLIEQDFTFVKTGPRISDVLAEQGVGIIAASEETVRLTKLKLVPVLPQIEGGDVPFFVKTDKNFMENPLAQFVTDWIFQCRDQALKSIGMDPQSEHAPFLGADQS